MDGKFKDFLLTALLSYLALQKKTKEYTGNDMDRQGAFKAAAALQHTTPRRGYPMKC